MNVKCFKKDQYKFYGIKFIFRLGAWTILDMGNIKMCFDTDKSNI